MARICREKASGKLIEAQSGDSPLGTLKNNAIAAGYQADSVEEIYLEDDEVHTLLNSLPEVLAREQITQQRNQDLEVNLPSWAQVQTAVNNITNLAEAKAFILKLSRVVYWLAKGSAT